MAYPYEVSANGTVFGIYTADTEQAARDLCAQDAGYQNADEMASRLGQDSALVARRIDFDQLDMTEEDANYFQGDAADQAALLAEGELAAWVDASNPNRRKGYTDYVAFLPSCARAAYVSNGDAVWFDATSLAAAVQQIQSGAALSA